MGMYGNLAASSHFRLRHLRAFRMECAMLWRHAVQTTDKAPIIVIGSLSWDGYEDALIAAIWFRMVQFFLF